MPTRLNARIPPKLLLMMDQLSWDDYAEYGTSGIVQRPFSAGAKVKFQVVMEAEMLGVAEHPTPGLWLKDAATCAFDLVGHIRKVRAARPSSRIPNPVASVLIDAGLPVTVNTSQASVDKLG